MNKFTSFKPSLFFAALALMSLSVAAQTEISSATVTRTTFSIADDPNTRDSGTNNDGIMRAGTNGTNQFMSATFTFDLDSNPTIRAAFEAATEFEITFNYSSFFENDPGTPLPSVDLEFFGTGSNSFSSSTFYPGSGAVARWDDVITKASTPGSFTVSSNDLDFGSIDFNGSSQQYALFRLTLSTTIDTSDGNGNQYVFGTNQSDYSITAVPEPTSMVLIGAALACLALFRRQR